MAHRFYILHSLVLTCLLKFQVLQWGGSGSTFFTCMIPGPLKNTLDLHITALINLLYLQFKNLTKMFLIVCVCVCVQISKLSNYVRLVSQT